MIRRKALSTKDEKRSFIVFNSAGLLEDLHNEIKGKLHRFDKNAEMSRDRTRVKRVSLALWNFFTVLMKGVPASGNIPKRSKVFVSADRTLNTFTSLPEKNSDLIQVMNGLIGTCSSGFPTAYSTTTSFQKKEKLYSPLSLSSSGCLLWL
uniref:DUF4371 domain-containing protein n=1 Tax=Steinernema glaseri TaxID=37863 RepID=A0A1I7XZS9_9BILA